jgi:hypothetical protein
MPARRLPLEAPIAREPQQYHRKSRKQPTTNGAFASFMNCAAQHIAISQIISGTKGHVVTPTTRRRSRITYIPKAPQMD